MSQIPSKQTRFTPRNLALLAALGSAALLLAAWGFQYLGGLAPCALCIWQRWPHGIAVLAGVATLASPLTFWGAAILGLGSTLTGAGIALYHSGVEQSWWEGPTTCTTSNDIGSLSVEELFAQIDAAPLVRCDEIPWDFLGLSMASWNGILTLCLAGLWAFALLQKMRKA